MKRRENNVILNKTFEFAADILDLNTPLVSQKHFVLANQVLRSGTSIGANVHEAQRAVSTADFVNKLAIALKEADETEYWLDLIDLKIIKINPELKENLQEIIRLLVSIINSKKRNQIKENLESA